MAIINGAGYPIGGGFKHVRMGSYRGQSAGDPNRYLCTTGIASCTAVLLTGIGLVGHDAAAATVRAACLGHFQTANAGHVPQTLGAMIARLQTDIGHAIIRVDAFVIKGTGNPKYPLQGNQLFQGAVAACQNHPGIATTQSDGNGHQTAVYDRTTRDLYIHSANVGGPLVEGTRGAGALFLNNGALLYDPP